MSNRWFFFAPLRLCGRKSLLAGAQKDFPVASLENKYLAAVTDSPALHAWRGRDVFVNHKTLVRKVFHGIGFNREARARRHCQRNLSVAGSRRKRVEIAVERNRAVAGARIDLPFKLDDANHTVAGVQLKLPTAISDFDRTVARTQRDLSGDS